MRRRPALFAIVLAFLLVAATPALGEARGADGDDSLVSQSLEQVQQAVANQARDAQLKADRIEKARRIARQKAKARAAARRRAAVADANPLADRPWGVYKGPGDQAWAPYVKATGTRKKLLAAIALRPKAKWFGAWISNSKIEASVRKYIANAAPNAPETLVQMSVFRMVPWEHESCRRLPTRAERASYRDWIRKFAAGIGAQHTAIILQPDGPFALCVPHHSAMPSNLIAYSAKVFSALPNTSVYIDGGAADWPPGNPKAAVDFLVADGIAYARGVALNSTHYSDTGLEIERARDIIEELAARGIAGKHAVINTSSNGKPFPFGSAPGKDPDNATVCASKSSVRCVTLGIPPTTDVTNTAWPLTDSQRTLAGRYVDGYLWFGRPWLYRQADPFDLQRALQLVRTTPYSITP